jgi:ankyrin repeat protein
MIAIEKNASKKIIKMLLKKGIDINVQDKEGTTALMHAARSNQIEIVKYFLKKGAEINAKDKDEYTVLSLSE